MYIFSSLYRYTDQNGNLVVNPAPVDANTPHVPWLAQRAAQLAPELAGVGCNAWLWPPLTMSQGGSANNADGYGKAYDLNVGQHAGRPTRWGFATDVQAANRKFHQLGMMVLEDAVIHQYAGNPTFFELGSDGKIDKTLFAKGPLCFVPNVKEDNVFAQPNPAFGWMASYQNSIPPGYMLNGVIECMKWRAKVFGLNGGRLDDTKGEASSVSKRIIERVGGFWFGENWTYTQELQRWVSESDGKNTLDFPLHWVLQGVCNNGISLHSLPGNGFYAVDSEHAVIFVDSADTDLNNNLNIKFNKLWAYLIALTLPAKATIIYGGDYEKYNLAADIRKIMWAGSMFAIGALTWEYLEDDFVVWSRNGDGGQHGWSGGLLCGFSRDPINTQYRWVHTPFGPNVHLHDYLGHGPDVWTNQDGWVNLQIGPNVNGSANNGVMYSKAGVNTAIRMPSIPETMNGSLLDFSDIKIGM